MRQHIGYDEGGIFIRTVPRVPERVRFRQVTNLGLHSLYSRFTSLTFHVFFKRFLLDWVMLGSFTSLGSFPAVREA